MNARAAIGACGSEERKSDTELVQQSPPGVGEVWAKRSELTPSHGKASITLIEAECQRRKVGRRSEAGTRARVQARVLSRSCKSE